MNILLASDDYMIKHYVEIGQNYLNYYLTNSNQPVKEYQNNNFDIVIVDISTYRETLLQILEINPKQKIIVISDNLDCIDEVGCDICQKKYNKHRLLKPININILLDLLNDFNSHECKYLQTDCFKNIKPILSDITKRFITYDFCSNKNLIYKKENVRSHSFVLDLLEIVGILDNHNTKYEIINGRDIQII
jgi:hypothetical protein